MPNVKNTMVDTLLSLIAPHLCSSCGRVGSLFCDNCKYDIIDESFSSCILCEKQSLNGVCAEHKVAFKQAWCVGARNDGLHRLLGGYKFRYMRAAAELLADLLDAHVPLLPHDCVIVPLPTALSHVRQRGYDHVRLIASAFASKRKLQVKSVLTRTNSFTQHHANKADRLKQAKTAYVLVERLDATRSYLLIDDIVTTGATISEAAKVLASTGATVYVAAIAKQPLD